jgi:hypothetical protein
MERRERAGRAEREAMEGEMAAREAMEGEMAARFEGGMAEVVVVSRVRK